MQRQTGGAPALNRLIGTVFVLLAVSGVGFAFSERPNPPMPETRVHIGDLLILDAARIGARIVALGERGKIFLSDDGGREWRTARTPSESTLTALASIDSRTLVAVGHDARILRSADAGERWETVFAAPEDEEPLLAVFFDAAGRGFAAGAYGRFMVSDDGGLSWERRFPDSRDLHLNAIVQTPSALFLAGESGTLLRSEDGGESWEPLDSPYHGSFFGAVATGDGGLLVFGMRGHLFHSADAGNHWETVPLNTTASLFGGLATADGRIYLVGQGGTLLVSLDAGRSFQEMWNSDHRVLTRPLDLPYSGELLLFGEGGVSRLPPVPLNGRS